jgi:uncharacterized protein (DUF488 family)
MEFDFADHWEKSIERDKENLAFEKQQLKYWQERIEHSKKELALDKKRLLETLAEQERRRRAATACSS